MIQDLLIKNGISTYFQTIFTQLNGLAQVRIAQTMPTQIGRILGLSVYTDSVTPAKQPLITINDALNTYLQFKLGSDLVIDNMRLDTLVYDTNAFTNTLLPEERFLPVNLTYEITLDQSIYLNPTLINGPFVALNLWYISKADFNNLIASGATKGPQAK